MEMKTCYKCKYFKVCGDVDRTEPCNGKELEITEGQAKAFYRDLCGTVYGDANKNSCGIMPTEMIAERMKISTEIAEKYLFACVEYGITENREEVGQYDAEIQH